MPTEILFLLLIVVGTVATAFVFVLGRLILRDESLTPLELFVAQQFLTASFMGFTFLFWGDFWEPEKINLLGFGVGVLIGLVVNSFISFAVFKSLRLADASLTAPAPALTVLLVALGGMLVFHETPSVLGMAAILMIVIGLFLHHQVRVSSLFFWRMFSRTDGTAVAWAYASAVVASAGLVSGAMVARNGNAAMGFMFQGLASGLIFLFYGFLTGQLGGKKKFMERVSKVWKLVLLLGVANFIAALFVNSAFRFSLVAYVGSIKRLSIPLVVILSWFILGEERAKLRLAPSLLISIGAVLLALEPATSAVTSWLRELLS